MKRIVSSLAPLFLLLALLCSCGGYNQAQALEELRNALEDLHAQESIHTQEEMTALFAEDESLPQTQRFEHWYYRGDYLYQSAFLQQDGAAESASFYLKQGDNFYICTPAAEQWALAAVPDPSAYAPYGANIQPETMELNVLSWEKKDGSLSVTCDNFPAASQETGNLTCLSSTACYTLDADGKLRSIVNQSAFRGENPDGSEYEMNLTYSITYLDTAAGQVAQTIADAAAQAQQDAAAAP